MIGFDTNTLVRLMVADDPVQAEHVRHFIGDHCSPDNPGFINNVVLAEVVWVLERTYGMGRDHIAATVERLLAAPELMVQDRAIVRRALEGFKRSSVGLADLLIAEINRANGCETTATFDRKAAKLDGFRLVR